MHYRNYYAYPYYKYASQEAYRRPGSLSEAYVPVASAIHPRLGAIAGSAASQAHTLHRHNAARATEAGAIAGRQISIPSGAALGAALGGFGSVAASMAERNRLQRELDDTRWYQRGRRRDLESQIAERGGLGRHLAAAGVGAVAGGAIGAPVGQAIGGYQQFRQMEQRLPAKPQTQHALNQFAQFMHAQRQAQMRAQQQQQPPRLPTSEG